MCNSSDNNNTNNKTKAQQTPLPRYRPLFVPHAAQKRTSKADSGAAAFYRTFLWNKKKKKTTLWTGKAFARLQRCLKPPALSAGPADAQCVNK